VRWEEDLSEIKIILCFCRGSTGAEHPSPFASLATFGPRIASIGPTAAPLIPSLGIASLLVAGSTAKFKKPEYGVGSEL